MDGLHQQDAACVCYTTRMATDRNLEALAYSLLLGQKEAAHRMGISVQTVKNHHMLLYRELDVRSAGAAAHKLGWLTIPASLIKE